MPGWRNFASLVDHGKQSQRPGLCKKLWFPDVAHVITSEDRKLIRATRAGSPIFEGLPRVGFFCFCVAKDVVPQCLDLDLSVSFDLHDGSETCHCVFLQASVQSVINDVGVQAFQDFDDRPWDQCTTTSGVVVTHQLFKLFMSHCHKIFDQWGILAFQ